MLQKSTVCLINWYKGRNLLVSPKGEQCFLVQTTWLQNSCSGSDSGIKETESLCGPYLNCGCFPIDVWPEPLERELHVAATSVPDRQGPCSSSEAPRAVTPALALRRAAGGGAAPGEALCVRLCECARPGALREDGWPCWGAD